MAPYLFHLFQLFLHVVNLVSPKPQGCKHEQEQHQHNKGPTKADYHGAPALLTAPDPLLRRRERPARYKTRWLSGVLRTSTSIHKEHLRERVALVTAHGVRSCRETNYVWCASITSAWRRCVLFVWASLTYKKKEPSCQDQHPQRPPTHRPNMDWRERNLCHTSKHQSIFLLWSA